MNYYDKTQKLLLIIILTILMMLITLNTQAVESSTVSSTNTDKEKTWTDSEVDALVDDLKIEKDKAIDEAVQKATSPILADNFVLRKELDFYKKNWNTVTDIIDRYKKDNETLKNILIFGGISVTALGFFAGYGIAQMF
jgi:predicted NAD-dependent protein-ADP-ribosyltransferase YbiA (DUF1768 family)